MSTVVSHPVFGEGEVLDSRWRRTEFLVRFRTGLQLWVAAARLHFAYQPSEPIAQLPARRIVEAFRLGIVPRQDVSEFTFGRAAEAGKVRELLHALTEGNGNSLVIEGDYGTGKTHLLEYIYCQALQMRLVVSRVEFDPVEVTPNRPKRMYRELVHNLCWLGRDEEMPELTREYGFRDLLCRATGLDMGDHVFFAPVLKRLTQFQKRRTRTADAELRREVFWQMIEGESTKEYAIQHNAPYRIWGGYAIPALYDFSTAGDYYCYILSGLSYICRQLGLNGLVVLIDEAETVTHLWDIIAYTRGMSFIEGLIRTAQNDPELKAVNTRLIHNRMRPTPYIYREPYILLVIATTPKPFDYTYLKMTNHAHQRLTLNPFREHELREAFERLIAIYQRAYPGFVLHETLRQELWEQASRRRTEGIRYFVKFCVEALDLSRFSSRVDFSKVRVAG